MRILKHLMGLMTIIFVVAACSAQTPTSSTNTDATPDFSGIPGILPTIPPATIQAYAQLADEEALNQGRTIYEQQCSVCHGLNGEGQFPEAPMRPDETGRIGAPPHTDAGHTWHHDDELLIQIVHEGGMGTEDSFYPMPPFGDILTGAEIESVIAYIKTFWTEEHRIIQAERSLMAQQQNQ